MKRFLPLLLAAALMLSLCPSALAASPNGTTQTAVYDYAQDDYGRPQTLSVVNLMLNGEPLRGNIPCVMLGSRTMAPIRLVAEALGADVEWLNDTFQVLVRKGGDTILLTLGSPMAYVNGAARSLPDNVPATLLLHEGQGYTMVPLRFFAETLGCEVTWDQSSYTAYISAPDTALLLEGLDTPTAPGDYLIVLDAGHGGPWSGAYYENTAEKVLNLSIVHKLDDILRALGYNTLLTRRGDEDVGLLERSRIANDAGADIFVSIHCNAAANYPSFQGLYVYHYPGSTQGAALAQAIQTPACQFTGAVDRGISSANFSVVRETKMPAVLVEAGFMTCSAELARLRDEEYQFKMAQGIAQGIIRYLNSQRS